MRCRSRFDSLRSEKKSCFGSILSGVNNEFYESAAAMSEGNVVKKGRPFSKEGEKHTKERIFDAALDLFARQGYESTSMREIAKSVGLTESAVYRHYPNKEAILDAVFAYAEEKIYTPLPVEETIGMIGSLSIFRGLLAPLPEIISADPKVLKITRIMYIEMLRNEKIRDYFKKEYIERADEYIENLFERCIEKGAIRPCDPRALARLFNAYRSEWAFTTFLLDPAEAVDIGDINKELERMILFFEEHFLPCNE